MKQFEYYDSQFSKEGIVLVNLRRWLNDESVDKNVTPPTLSSAQTPPPTPYSAGWTDLSFKSMTPQQLNGCAQKLPLPIPHSAMHTPPVRVA